MEGNNRRQRIIQLLNDTTPISATYFAKMFGVSRQVIVGDIALLRAQGTPVIATSRGYIINSTTKNTYIIPVAHEHDRTREELELLVSMGAKVINVIVEHPIYGELQGNLNIENKQDIEIFMSNESKPLSILTGGIHLHTIVCDNDLHFNSIKDALVSSGFWYSN